MNSINCFWYGAMTDFEVFVMQTWLRLGYEVNLWCYETKKIDGIPEAVIQRDASEIIANPKALLFNNSTHWKKDSVAVLPLSDVFRFALLKKYGGLWLDLDLPLVKRIPDSLLEADYCFSSEATMRTGFRKSKEAQKMNIGVVWVKHPESEFCSLVVASTLLKLQSSDHTPWSGMSAAQDAAKRLNLLHFVQPWTVFCPLPWWSLQEAVSQEQLRSLYGVKAELYQELPQDCIGVHLWRGIARSRNVVLTPEAVYRQSWLGRLYHLLGGYLVPNSQGSEQELSDRIYHCSSVKPPEQD